jgi:SAM-dependent methyltransferase
MTANDPRCRACGAPLSHSFIDLGMSPLCESYLSAAQLNAMEPFYPLHAYVCTDCWLVQLQEYVSGEAIFSDYAYFSSYSDSWVLHARRYVDAMVSRFRLGKSSKVFEVASNDGYLLQHVVAAGIPCLGIEPAANVAKVAVERGIPTEVHFLGRDTARDIVMRHGPANLVAANNVMAHVPDLNDFVAGLATLLAPDGVLTVEVPHLLKLVAENQFDTIYHEHFCYFSLVAAERVFARHGLVVFDVEELSTHGGSLRYFARHAGDTTKPVLPRVAALRDRERALGVESLAYYHDFTAKVEETKRQLLTFLIDARRAGARVVGYGAPGKGNTLLNYCGIRTDLLEYTVDRSPHKQGMYLPGTHIPIHAPERIGQDKPDYVLILPWNLRDEIVDSMAFVRDWGGRFVVPIPETTVLE